MEGKDEVFLTPATLELDESDGVKVEVKLEEKPEPWLETSTCSSQAELVPPEEDENEPSGIILESHRKIFAQTVVPFFIAGMGMVGAGVLLNIVQHWTVFEQLPEVLILVPPLLGLKGNLEMTLASRMSTAANTGHLDTRKGKIDLVFGNMALLQVQSILVGLLAAVVAFVFDIELTQAVNWNHLLLLSACGMVTASLASLILGSITASVILLSKMWHLNPDNIATPIAGALGDMTALTILSISASAFYQILETDAWVFPVICAALLLTLPPLVIVAKRYESTREVLFHGWTPIIVAMLIQVCAGLILDIIVARSKDVAIFQPVVNGVAGNLVAIQASKMSTYLHQCAKIGALPTGMRICLSPITVFFSKLQLSRTARVLMALVIPGHLIFAFTISFAEKHGTNLSAVFLAFYLIAVFIQVSIVIYLASVLTHFFWTRGKDPDNNCIPYMTATGDFLGILFMGFVFELLRVMGIPT
ncbi:solute carrier family 41 member 1-like [Neocloeon triangulifer]|uniref:solute carrier family 41 member 1-like n=1 Tax=Neocloeon triangulifer TaxID=2078957 RepID=UPI00286FA132|nr:solute carrier family 41 member 1-like [Neocloeon triangulifer]